MLSTIVLAACSVLGPQDAPTARGLVSQGRALLPAYAGDHRSFLTADQRSKVSAAGHLMSAALALEPGETYALWWKAHTDVLLGEDSINRGSPEVGESHYTAALSAFDRALGLDPSYAWAWYARGLAKQRLNRPIDGLADLNRCLVVCEEQIAAAQDDQARADPLFLRYKARQWRADLLMQVFRFDDAREEFRRFYAENGNNRWDLAFSIGETLQRERDFAGAVRNFEDLLGIEGMGGFDGAHAQLGYLQGLLGDLDAASKHLGDALGRERTPGLYLRAWMWILASETSAARAQTELRNFVTQAPSSTPPWDLQLGRLLISDVDENVAQDFIAQASAEEARRKAEGLELGDLMCEAWFYVGWKFDRQHQPTEASKAYRQALRFRPAAFKWEWAFARKFYGRLIAKPLPYVLPLGAERVQVHRAGESEPRSELPTQWLAADLVSYLYTGPDCKRRAVVDVVLHEAD